MVRGWLFFVSYAPLALIFGLRALPNWLGFAIGAGYFVVFTALAWFALHRQRRSSTTPVALTGIRGQGAAVSGYLATYLLPFLGTGPQGLGDWLAYVCYFLVALIVHLRSDLALVNPTLYLLGYRIAEATHGDRLVLVVSRGPLPRQGRVLVTDFLDAYVVRTVDATRSQP